MSSSSLLRKPHIALVSSLYSMYQEEHIDVGVLSWSWLGCYSGWFGLLFDQNRLLDCRKFYVLARTRLKFGR
jgi:hypothetical protein